MYALSSNQASLRVERALDQHARMSLGITHLSSIRAYTLRNILKPRATMIGPHFFDVPVYRLSPERYESDKEAFIQKHIYRGSPEYIEFLKNFYLQRRDSEEKFREHLSDIFGGSWNYNEIIGYIELHFLGSQIRGEYWQMKGKRIARTRKKIFEYRTWKLAPELDVPRGASNEVIFDKIQEYLGDCARELKGRYLDLRRLKIIGPHVDWRAILYSQS